jgi:hypothetical protein
LGQSFQLGNIVDKGRIISDYGGQFPFEDDKI